MNSSVSLPAWDGVSRVLTATERKLARIKAKEEWNALPKEQQVAIENAAYDEKCKARYRKDPDSLSRRLLCSRPGLAAEYADWKARNGIVNVEERRKTEATRRYFTQVRHTPKWDLELDQLAWRELRSLRKAREKATGIKWAIDHIIPLRGYRVSGLHTALNWQLIPSWMNNQKLNRLVLTKHDEWIAFLNHDWLPCDIFRTNWRSSPYYDPYRVG
ncbi:hypothetical protein [Pseudomonas sp.]|uniref:hypothetical protein n=1 Tax=Pseudomonas sp. TaxID=306 RepID=UPI0032668F86